jgi:predicted RNase H-like HicB family nuclease
VGAEDERGRIRRKTMAREYYMIIERDETGWYVGNIPELPGCHTQGATVEELTIRMREAIALYLEDEDTAILPASEFIGVHRVAVS